MHLVYERFESIVFRTSEAIQLGLERKQCHIICFICLVTDKASWAYRNKCRFLKTKKLFKVEPDHFSPRRDSRISAH